MLTATVAPAPLTESAFSLYRIQLAPGAGGPGPHFHRTFAESFYVLAGTARLFDGRRWIEADAGDFLHVPPGGVHAFNNQDSDEPADMLMLTAPGAAREDYFAELAERAAANVATGPDEQAAFLARHDQYMV